MKYYTLLACLLLLNCKLIRLTSKENLQIKTTQMKFDLTDRMNVNVKVDETQSVFMFDTGASNNIVFDTTLIKDFATKERLTFLSPKDPNGKLISFYTPSNIETEMFLFENNLVTVIPFAFGNNKCYDYSNLLKGIIGSSFIKKNVNKYYQLDFDKLVITNSNQINIDNTFKEVKSIFFNNHFAIFLKINGFEESFIFDTGNVAFPLTIGVNSKIKPANYIEYEGSEATVVSGQLKANTKYSNDNNILISDYNFNSSICFLDTEMKKHNNLGLEFIKNFNWIIDYENKKVYFKRNNLKTEKMDIIPQYKYLCLIEKDILIIATKLKSENKFQIGQQIVSVNNKIINSENICEMQKYLNSSSNWNDLEIVVK